MPEAYSSLGKLLKARLRGKQDVCLDPADISSPAAFSALRSLRLQLPHDSNSQALLHFWPSAAGLAACRSLTTLALAHSVLPVLNKPPAAVRQVIQILAGSLQCLQPLLTRLDSFAH